MAAGRVLESTDNGGVTEAVFTRHLNEHIRLEKLASEVRAKQKALKKAAEDDGVIMADMKDALKIASEDPATVIERQNRITQYANWLKAPVGAQLQMLEMPPDQSKITDEQREQKWSDEGFQAGLLGKNRDTCPHDPNSPGGRAWLQGYEQGQKRNLGGIKGPDGKPVTESAPAAANADKPKRGRPKKNQSAAPSSGSEEAAPPAPGDSAEQADIEEAVQAAPPAPPAPPSDEDDEWERAAPDAAA